jgi:ribosomal protein S18 acetylase RimI-like enzyme
MTDPNPDTSVRLAWATDAPAIAAVQVASWRQAYAGLLPSDVLAALPVDQMSRQWELSISRPSDARQRVLVALDRASVRGFAATLPSADADASPAADGEIAEFAVAPEHRHRGHGSRLLHAAVDTLRSDKFSRATVWVNATNDQLRGFLLDQGWAPDGAHRELDLHGDGAVLVKQVRLHTDLTV